MNETQNPKKYDLEERTFGFAKNTGNLTRKLPKTLENIEYRKQLVRSSGILESERGNLIREAVELRKIFGAILEKSK